MREMRGGEGVLVMKTGTCFFSLGVWTEGLCLTVRFLLPFHLWFIECSNQYKDVPNNAQIVTSK